MIGMSSRAHPEALVLDLPVSDILNVFEFPESKYTLRTNVASPTFSEQNSP
jgi:hypothetical protein